ncbi:MAG: ATP-binding protein [Xanthomonadales bacterium]|jgi:signal transduction histidine kinase|nr:ATP-binding protein [Xanthomonadales bacterium]
MGGFTKYRGLIVAISLFLVVVAGVTGVNLYIARDLNQDAIGVNLSGRQRMLSQRTAKTILQVQSALKEGADPSAALQELAGAVKLFDQTLGGFRNGAEVTGGAGLPVFLAQAAVGQDKIEAAIALWEPYKRLLAPLVGVDGNVIGVPEVDQVERLVRYAVENNVKILGLMNELTSALEVQATERAARLRVIQIAALATALMLFAYIVFFSLRNLRKADQDVLLAKQETDNILNTVNDGLFLIDRELRIGSQQSKSLEQIFGVTGLAGRSLLDVLGRLVPEKTLDTARTFLDLLFGERVKEALMGEVNPLREVEVSIVNANGVREQRYLAFQFRRVLTDDKLTHLLVSARNITQEIELRRELEVTRKRSEEQVALLTKMMHLGGAELGSFMDKTQTALDEMNAVLAVSGLSKQENMGKLAKLFRLVHTIKGDAAALDFDPIEAWAHRVEDQMHELRKRDSIDGSDMLALTVAMREMYQQIGGIRDLVAKLSQVRATLETADSSRPKTSVWAKAQMLAGRVADREGKRVKFNVHKDPGLRVANVHFHELSDVLVQLVRNAIVHGIERPEQRAASGKSPEGRVNLSFLHGAQQTIEINVEDDGAGINLEKVRKLGVQRGLLAPEIAAAATPRDLVKLLLTPGFSTAEQVTEDAGRGVGLDVIEKAVQRLGGRLSISSRWGQGARFSVILPGVEAEEGVIA